MTTIANRPLYNYGLLVDDYRVFKQDIKIVEFTDTVLKVKSPMQYGSKLTKQIAATMIGNKSLRFDYINFEPFDDKNDVYVYKVGR